MIHNHLKDGDHTINSYIYWNGPKGFDRSRRSELPTFGPHMSQMTDAGNLMTRRLEEEYVSPAVELPTGRSARRLRWVGEERGGSRLKFQVRAAGSRAELDRAPWGGAEGSRLILYRLGHRAARPDKDARVVQYRALFTSPNGGEWPVLSAVEFVLR